ncbi:TRAP transporter large permease subunit [Aureimonas fodinaquatilis]|uniref:TRAP transporter large permease subunit n=1 Tax=Aureimonas fodinaquatilis TaxID=2565783 RepID=A0A5B0DUW0_9HYPH|nr:TRAP transporter large permease subunit [Aureimonas fodinaquatilis]KAA0969792.1 TRAP transporter large permease subunit [Aureimonas fodinaquatilis]
MQSIEQLEKEAALEGAGIASGSAEPINGPLGKLRNGLEAVLGASLFTLLSIMTLTVFAGVISRYVFNNAFAWTEEVAILAFTWLIFLGATIGVARDAHIGVEIIPVPKTALAQTLFLALRNGIVAFVLIMMVFAGYRLTDLVGGLSPVLQWPNSIRYAVVPIAGALALFFLATRRSEAGNTFLGNVLAIAIGGAFYAALSFGAGDALRGISPSLIIGIGFFVCLALGVPVAFSLLAGVFLTTFTGGLLPAPGIVQNATNGVAKFILLAIPFFLSAGFLLNLGGLAARLIAFASSLVGHFRGGLAHVNILNSFLVGGISGSPGADAASSTKIIVPEMVKRGYDPAFSCAVTATSAILPNVVPPAIAMLVFASVVEVSIAKLFIAGIIPAILITIALMVCAYIISVRRNYERADRRAPLSVIGRSFVSAIPVLLIVVLVLGGIRFGVTTATEAGVMALVWTFLLGKFVYRAYTWGEFYESFRDCAVATATVAFLIAATAPFAWSLIAEQIPQVLIAWSSTFVDTRFGLLLLTNAILLIVGLFLDLTPAMLIVAPLLMPALAQFGVDPVQAGIIMIVTLQLGGVTPPVGILVFISSQIAKVKPGAVFREAVPFIISVLVIVLLLDLFPWLTLGLWDMF